jgi:hypothetical protein
MSDPQASRLDGWKAIADYLGRDSRTAQRWHHDRGMPVHHVAGARSGGVFAYREELDKWLETGPAKGSSDTAEEQPGSAVPPNLSAPQQVAWSPRRTAVVGGFGAAVLILASAASIGVFEGRSSPPPAFWNLNGTLLSALDVDQKTIWTSALPRFAGDTALRPALARAMPVDVDNDGDVETVAVVNYGTVHDNTFDHTEAYCFSSEGRLLWEYRPTRSLTFGGRDFGGRWRSNAAAVSTARNRSVWLALIEHTWWPSFVVSLDSRGNERLAFVNAGHLWTLQEVESGGRLLMLAGGVNNEFMLPALAAFYPDGPAASSPQSPDTHFACSNCPRQGPARYLLFPRSEVDRATVKSVVPVTDIGRPDASGMIEVSVRNTARSTRVIYRLSSVLLPESVGFSDAYWNLHDELAASGTLDHASDECPERQKGVTARVWEPDAGWRDIHVPPLFRTSSPIPGG